MNTYAYIRVSTKEQNIDRQLKALEKYKIPKQNIFSDYQSGKDFDRPAYRKMLKKLREGDLLIVKSIDRLGRNYNDILVQWQHITKNMKANIFRDGTEEKKTEVVEASADPKTSLEPVADQSSTDEESEESKQNSAGIGGTVWILIAIAVLGFVTVIIAITLFVKKKHTLNKKNNIEKLEKGVRCSCGFVNHSNAKYCTKCGKKIG